MGFISRSDRLHAFAYPRSLVVTLTALIACGKAGGSSEEGSSSSSSSSGGEPEPIPCSSDEPCPEDHVCLVSVCYAGEAPTVAFATPQNAEVVPWDSAAPTTVISVMIEGENLELVPEDEDPDSLRGRGQVVLALDGTDIYSIDSGDLGQGIGVDIELPSTGGAHRLHAEARLTDGRVYDNRGAYDDVLFWFDDGEVRVAFNYPAPKEKLTNAKQSLQVEVATLNFQLVPAGASAEPGDVGIAHVYLDQDFPACAADAACAAGYSAVLSSPQPSPTASASLNLPATSNAETTLTVLLARTDHSPYCASGGADPCGAVYDEVTVQRIDPDGSPPATTSGGESSGGGADSTGG